MIIVHSVKEMAGVPDWIRTNGPRIRNPVLYPAELRGQPSAVAIVQTRTRHFNRGPPDQPLAGFG
jgi:hypothetical protein